MLLQLDIKNYAIIDEVSIPFSNNLNVITGETGAGKSILLGALSLILGVRANKGSLRNKEQKAAIEGVFHLPNRKEIGTFFSDNDLDYAEDTILRREISPSGKSRAFINDTPVNLNQLSFFSSLLVDLHQQFDTLQLGQSDFQLHVLDVLAGQKDVLTRYQIEFHLYLKNKKYYGELKDRANNSSKESDYHRFLLDELIEAHFTENELEDLDLELKQQSHTEELKQSLVGAASLLEENDPSIISQLKEVQNQLDSLGQYHDKLPDLLERLSSTQIELQDISGELEQINENVEYDEERLSIIQDRLNIGYKLLKKHQLQTTGELLELQASLQEKLNEEEHLDAELEAAQKEYEQQFEAAQKIAEKITKNRRQQAQPFVEKLQKLLKRVGMPNAKIKILIDKGNISEYGQDQVSFEFDANNSGEFQPIKKVASGGELSRLMLCIKSLIAHSATLPTLIFDEIESGISGEAAKQVGLLLRELANNHQVICISHQPQVAARAKTHFQVAKAKKHGIVASEIHKLSQEERIRVIAGMLSGDQPTEAALTNAKEMMEGNTA